MTGPRVLVCGGRDFNARDFAFACLDAHAASASVVIHGGARGADTLAGEWAMKRQRVPVIVYHADWNAHGRSAGPIRNAKMLAEGKPDLVIAFPGGKGTAHMVSIARKAGVPVIEVLP